jgi:hypothetical protein
MCGNRWSLDPPRLHFERLKLLNFDFNADINRDLDPSFHSNVNSDPDLDPASQNNADPKRIRIHNRAVHGIDVFFKELFSTVSICLNL